MSGLQLVKIVKKKHNKNCKIFVKLVGSTNQLNKNIAKLVITRRKMRLYVLGNVKLIAYLNFHEVHAEKP